VAAVMTLASQSQGDGRVQIPGVDLYRSFEWLRLAPPGMDRLENRNFRLAAPAPGVVRVPGGACAVRLELIENKDRTKEHDSGYNKLMDCLDWDRIAGALELRNWRPGDQYRPVGHGNSERIKRLFHEARIPLWERRSWPVITRGEEIIWARRFGPAANAVATRESRMLLRIQETPA